MVSVRGIQGEKLIPCHQYMLAFSIALILPVFHAMETAHPILESTEAFNQDSICKEIFDPAHGLFEFVGRPARLLHLQPMAEEAVTEEMKGDLHFVGRFLGLAIKKHWCLPVTFSTAFLKTLLSDSAFSMTDLAELDLDLANGLECICWPGTDLEDLDLNFSISVGSNQVELIPGGAYVKLLDENMMTYVPLAITAYCSWGRGVQAAIIKQGIDEVLKMDIDLPLLQRMLRSFESDLNVDDLMFYADYNNCDVATPSVRFLFECLRAKTKFASRDLFERLAVNLHEAGTLMILYVPNETSILVDLSNCIVVLPRAVDVEDMRSMLESATEINAADL